MTIEETTGHETGVTGSKWLQRPVRARARGAHGARPARDRARCPASSTAATCATGRTRSGRSTRRRTTGSPATAWSTASGCATAGPSGTATAGCARRRSSAALGEEPEARGSATAGWRRPTRTSSGSPGARSPSSRPAARPVELTDELDTIATATSAARCPTATRRTPRSTRPPASLHAIAYHWALPHLQYVVVGADGSGQPGRADRGRRRADGPRLLDHRAVDGRLRPARSRSTSTTRCAAPASRTPGRRTARPASGWCRSAGAGATCAGSTSPRATCSTRSNAYDDGERVVLDVVRYGRMFDDSRLGPDDVDAAAVALDARPRRPGASTSAS